MVKNFLSSESSILMPMSTLLIDEFTIKVSDYYEKKEEIRLDTWPSAICIVSAFLLPGNQFQNLLKRAMQLNETILLVFPQQRLGDPALTVYRRFTPVLFRFEALANVREQLFFSVNFPFFEGLQKPLFKKIRFFLMIKWFFFFQIFSLLLTTILVLVLSL